MAQFVSWLWKQQSHEGLEGAKAFLMHAGERLWIPCGCIPLIVGLAEAKTVGAGKKKRASVSWPDSKKKQSDFKGYLFMPILGYKNTAVQREAANRLLALMASSVNDMPKTLHGSQCLKELLI